MNGFVLEGFFGIFNWKYCVNDCYQSERDVENFVDEIGDFWNDLIAEEKWGGNVNKAKYSKEDKG